MLEKPRKPSILPPAASTPKLRYKYLVETLPEHLLIVFRFGKLEQDPRGGFRQAEAAPEVQLVADARRLVQAQVVGGCQQKCP